MTLRAWMERERRPEYSGINARATLKRLGDTERRFSKSLFGLAIATRWPPLKRDLFKFARNYAARGL